MNDSRRPVAVLPSKMRLTSRGTLINCILRAAYSECVVVSHANCRCVYATYGVLSVSLRQVKMPENLHGNLDAKPTERTEPASANCASFSVLICTVITRMCLRDTRVLLASFLSFQDRFSRSLVLFCQLLSCCYVRQ